jgi:hypothetical protein
LKRDGRRSQYCGRTDNPKHSELFHDRTSILIIAPYEDNAGHCAVAFALKPKTADTPAPSPRFCQSFLLAMSGHAGPIQIDVGVTPVVCRVSRGQAVALLNGLRACRADLNVSSRASEGDRSHPEDCDCRCQSERRRGVSGKLRFRRQHWRISCDVSMLLTRAREPLSQIFIHRSHEYVLNSDGALSGINNDGIQSSWMKAP